MSVYNIQYRKIVNGYFFISNYIDFEVSFVEKSNDWFLLKKGRQIIFNTNLFDKVKPFVDRIRARLHCSIKY